MAVQRPDLKLLSIPRLIAREGNTVMSSDDTTAAYILDCQIEIFEAARHDLQLPLTEIAKRTGLPVATVNAWAQGRNSLSLWGVKKLLRIKELAPLLSRLFAPEEHLLLCLPAEFDPYRVAEDFHDFLVTKGQFHAPESECGPAIGPTERKVLHGKFAKAVNQ
jgi:DNA-binding transcriptional regulator YiaG